MHHEFVKACLKKYEASEIPEGMGWELAHYPLPECKGGSSTIRMWACDHALQGVLQSEELDYPCIHGFNTQSDAAYLKEFYPEFLPLFEKWSKILRGVGGRKGGKKSTAANISPEARKRAGETARKKCGIPVRCLDTGIVYESLNQAQQATGVYRGSIASCVRGESVRAGGLRWEKALPPLFPLPSGLDPCAGE